jgi:hypothetical protein
MTIMNNNWSVIPDAVQDNTSLITLEINPDGNMHSNPLVLYIQYK